MFQNCFKKMIPSKTIVRLRPSPKAGKKWRVSFSNAKEGEKRHVDFGQSGASDYTRHKDTLRMIAYLRRHAANIPPSLDAMAREAKRERKTKKQEEEKKRDGGEEEKESILRLRDRFLSVTSSRREKWGEGKGREEAIRTPGFWSRWLLWSLPSLDAAKRHISRTFGVVFA